MDALEAAVSNSLDHWESLQRGYSALKEKLEEQACRHESMLEVRQAIFFFLKAAVSEEGAE